MFAPSSVLTGQPFRITLGLRRLDPATWLDLAPGRREQLDAKRTLLAGRHEDVVRHLPGSEPAAEELLDLIVDHLAQRAPHLDASPDSALHPVDAAGRLVCEDLCVLERSAGADWRLTAASVCFPSRWRLADKIGRTIGDIHGPVPGYGAIAAPVDAFFDRLTEDRPMWRTNWSLLPGAELFQDGSGTPREVEPGELAFRVERQTLRPLPRTGAVVFTIHTSVQPLADLLRGRPDRAADLAATLGTVGPDTAAYKGWDVARLVTWLESRA